MSARAGRPRRNYKINSSVLSFASLLLVTALFRASQNAVQTMIAPLGDEVLRLSPSVVGLAVTFVGAAAVVANLLLVTRLYLFRLHRLATFGLVALTVAILGMVFGDSILLFLTASAVLGISGGLLMPVFATLAARVPGVKRDRALAAYAVALSAGLAVGPLIESVLLSSNGGSLRKSVLSFAAIPLVAAVLMLFVRLSAGTTSNLKQDTRYPASLLLNAPLRLAVVGQLLFQIPFVSLVTFGALVAHSLYGASASLAQLAFSAFFGVSFAARIALVWKPIKNNVLALRIAAVTTLLGITLLGTCHSILLLMIAMGLLGLPHGVIYPISISLIAKGTASVDLAKANSILFISTSVVSVVGPFLLGVIVSNLGYRLMLGLELMPVVVLAIVLFKTHLENDSAVGLARGIDSPNA